MTGTVKLGASFRIKQNGFAGGECVAQGEGVNMDAALLVIMIISGAGAVLCFGMALVEYHRSKRES